MGNLLDCEAYTAAYALGDDGEEVEGEHRILNPESNFASDIRPGHDQHRRDATSDDGKEVSSLPDRKAEFFPLGKLPLMRQKAPETAPSDPANALRARSISKLCVSALRDWRSRNRDGTAELRIVEMVSSLSRGLLGLSIRHYIDSDYAAALPPNTRCVVILADPDPAFVASLSEAHRGIDGLEMATYDPANPLKGVDLIAGEAPGPPLMCVFVDVLRYLPHDAVQIRPGGVLARAHIRLGPPLEWQFRPCGSKNGFRANARDPRAELAICNIVNDIYANSAEYPELGRGSTILIPTGAFDAVCALLDASGGNLVLVCEDDAATSVGELLGLRHPALFQDIHGVAVKTNFHALGLLSRHLDENCTLGYTAMTPHAHGRKMCASFYAMVRKTTSTASSLSSAAAFVKSRYSRARSRAFTTRCAHSVLRTSQSTRRLFRQDCRSPSLPHMLSILRLCSHDPSAYFSMRKAILAHVCKPRCGKLMQRDVVEDLERIVRTPQPLGTTDDVAFEAGRLYMAVKEYARATAQFVESVKRCGDHHVTRHNISLCRYYQSDRDGAIASFKAALKINPSYSEAQKWLRKLTGSEQ